MAIMLQGNCPKCDKEVKYGGTYGYEPVPLCKRCQYLEDLKQESCAPEPRKKYIDKNIFKF